MSKKSIRRSEASGGNSAGWLTTFNDLVTLLMVFFVLLFTMSTIDTRKMKDFQYALQSGLGVLREGSQVSVSVKETQPISDMAHSLTQAEEETEPEEEVIKQPEIERALSEFFADLGIQVTYSNQGARITLEDCLLFDFGKADINATGFPFLNEIAALIHKVPYPVRIEGHTDNVPIHTKRFASNWELSIARAVNVVKYLVDVGRVNPKRLSAVGYGDSRPVTLNTTPVDRAKNRRVEILLVTEGKS